MLRRGLIALLALALTAGAGHGQSARQPACFGRSDGEAKALLAQIAANQQQILANQQQILLLLQRDRSVPPVVVIGGEAPRQPLPITPPRAELPATPPRVEAPAPTPPKVEPPAPAPPRVEPPPSPPRQPAGYQTYTRAVWRG